MRVHLQTLGCRLNEAEAQGWARELTAAGHLLVDDPARADLVICNTCAVTGAATRKSRQLVRRLRRDSPAAELVVTGCYGTLHAAQAARDLGIDRLVGNADKDRLARLVAAPHAAAPAGSPRRAQQLGRERVFLKVQDGCRYRCAFCVVTAARGDEVSRPLPELVAEVRALVAAGVPEVVLTGVHVGGYGSDRGSSLTALVAALLAETAVPRLRLASVEPWELSDAFFALFADPRLLPHLHLPLQSGSDAVLRAMARRGRRDDFRALVTRARERVPGLNLTSDLIAGFPGESDADWAQTLELVDELAFGDLHVFP
ncbi:MAG TPA: MiaB/RimO family radical SAM methylthiotransferase, partial [Gammaproteobacteria bacterium]